MKTEALQQAIYDRLNGVTEITDAVTGIYTKVPQAAQSEDGSAFPFVTIGPFTPTPWNTDDTKGVTVLADVGVWSRSNSDLARRSISDDVYDALDRYQLSITGANTVDCLFENMVELDDPDGVTTHSILTFRITYDGT